MNGLSMILAAALTFGVCFLLDKGYTKVFRSRQQHKSGLAVRVNKRYATFGIILILLGVIALFSGLTNGKTLLIGGAIVLLIGIGLVVYYMSFAVFYDAEGFLHTAPGKKDRTYRYGEIRGQKLYLIQGGNIVVELHMTDGSAVSIQTAMEGAYPFLDYAFARWCEQTGRNAADCDFHDPANSLWFPTEEE